MTAHQPVFSSVRFSAASDEGDPTRFVEVVEAHCTCGLSYRATGGTLSEAARQLEQQVFQHLDAMAGRGEPIEPIPGYASRSR